MTDGAFGWAVVASVGAHVLGLAGAAVLAVGAHDAPPPAPVPIEVVQIAPPPPPPPAPPPRRAPEPLRRPDPPRPRPEPREPAPLQPMRLIEDTPALEAAPPARRAPEPGMPAEAVAMNRTGSPGVRDAARGAGALFSTGDLPVWAGRGAGGTGRDGSAGAGGGQPVASAPAGVTSFARPLGGYQTAPRYPDSARLAGIEGVALLRFVVLANGTVGTINVERSAGHADLDRAAVEAVTTWRFEPARRGKEAVPVWVTLPVRFELTNR